LQPLLAPQLRVSSSDSARKLAISAIDVFPIREPGSGDQYSVVRVATQAGLNGFGECARASAQELSAVRQFWLGRPATSYAVTKPETPLAGAMDMALLDIVGKSCNAPVYRVLGGPTRNKVRAYASVPGESAELLKKVANAGYRAFGLRVPSPTARNQGKAYQIAIRSMAELVRVQGGEFILEGNALLTPGDAAVAAAGIQPFHPLWFDEPCESSSLQTLHKITDESVVPLGFGRDVKTPGGFQDLLRAGLVDIVRPDIHQFGLTQTRRIAALAETYYVAVAPRHNGGPIATAAALHLAASLPNFFIQHIPYRQDAEARMMRAALTGKNVETVRDGFASLPAGPGLGITVNEKILERYHAA